MLRLFFNALAASSASGLTYVRNVAPRLAEMHQISAVFLIQSGLSLAVPASTNITFVELENVPGASRRFWWEQQVVPRLVKEHAADILISTGNFAVRKSPVPQILLSGNSLYTSRDFRTDLLKRKHYGLWLDNEVRSFFAKRSISWTDCTIAPTEAFASELRYWSGRPVAAIRHGFDRDVFLGSREPAMESVATALTRSAGSLRILFVSHYNYYRNFETLFRALPLIQKYLPGRDIKLLLTTKLRSEENPGSFRAESAAALVRELGITASILELGAIPYPQLHHLYGACDLYVTPAYAETFAHPLVEAMSCGLPIVASDLAVHREVARDAALYFATFSAEALARQAVAVANSRETQQALSQNGLRRSQDFSWKSHVEALIALARQLQLG